MSSGYHQVNLHEDSRDIFQIVLTQGKFRYCVLPQGASVSSDYFNICTDPDIRGTPGLYKNIDDVLVEIGRRVDFGGVTIEACKTRGYNQSRVYLSPSEEKLQAFLDLKAPESKVDVQRAFGMIAQMKKFCPGVMLTFPLLQKLSAHNAVFTWNDSLQAEFDNLKSAM